MRDFELRRKRAGHLLSKSRYVSAQLLAYVETGVWRRNAPRTNALAQQIARAAGSALLYPVEANEVFLRLGPNANAALRAAGFEFYDWGPESSGEARLVVSWDQRDEDVEAYAQRCANAPDDRSAKLSKPDGHRLTRRAQRREQPADQADGQRPLQPIPQQRRGDPEREHHLAEVGSQRRGRVVVENRPRQARAEHPAQQRQQQRLDHHRDDTGVPRKPMARNVAISRVRVATAAYMELSAPNTAPIAMITPTTVPRMRMMVEIVSDCAL